LLLTLLGVALWRHARQIQTTAEMQKALALADERSLYLERLSLVASGLAHEIKNPLGSLRGFTQLLAEKVASGSKEKEYAALMLTELDGITRRVDGLRHFTQPGQPNLNRCRPAEIIRRVTSLLAPDLRAKELCLEQELSPAADGETLADEDWLRDLVVNLLINAIEASPRQGRIRLGLSLTSPASATEYERFFTLEVEDEGPGIAESERARVMRPFYSTKKGNLGIGLALAQRAVEGLGGMLTIDGAAKGGALFRARWPDRG
jgi:two-component system sensor histidine kinase HydH